MDIRKRLYAVPRSYEDFVNYTAAYMERDDALSETLFGFMDSNPDANSGDVLEVLVNYLGLGEPLEIVDDEIVDDDEERYAPVSGRAMRAVG